MFYTVKNKIQEFSVSPIKNILKIIAIRWIIF